MNNKQGLPAITSDSKDFWSGIGQLLRRLPEKVSFGFSSSCIIFLLVHIYHFTNFSMNRDNALFGNGIGGLYGRGGGVESGRFLLALTNSLSGDYAMPWVVGLLSTLYFALTVCVLVLLFKIRHKGTILLLALLLASFPASACTLSYTYTADSYFLAILLASAGVLLTRRLRWGWLPGAALIAASLGIYQAYFPFAAALAVISLLFFFLQETLSPKEILLSAIRSVAALLLALVLYKYLLELLLHITGKTLDSYAGIDHMWYLPVWVLPERISTAFRFSFAYYRIRPFFSDLCGYAYVCAMLLSFLLVLFTVVRSRLYRRPLQLLGIIGLLLCLPLACSLSYVMSNGVHSVMLYAVVLQLVAAALALDQLDLPCLGNRFGKLLGFVLAVSLLLIGLESAIVVNKAYFKMNLVYEHTYSFYTRMFVRMEETEGYRPGMPIVMLGDISEEVYPLQNPELEELETLTGISTRRSLFSSYVIPAFSKFILGEAFHPADESLQASTLEKIEEETMPVYPQPGCIRIVDDVMVIKLGE